MSTDAQHDQPQADGEPVLVCPECLPRHGGAARIGNRKTTCAMCNRFAQAVRRRISRDLLRAHPDEAERLRAEAERDAYARLVGTTEAVRR